MTDFLLVILGIGQWMEVLTSFILIRVVWVFMQQEDDWKDIYNVRKDVKPDDYELSNTCDLDNIYKTPAPIIKQAELEKENLHRKQQAELPPMFDKEKQDETKA